MPAVLGAADGRCVAGCRGVTERRRKCCARYRSGRGCRCSSGVRERRGRAGCGDRRRRGVARRECNRRQQRRHCGGRRATSLRCQLRAVHVLKGQQRPSTGWWIPLSRLWVFLSLLPLPVSLRLWLRPCFPWKFRLWHWWRLGLAWRWMAPWWGLARWWRLARRGLARCGLAWRPVARQGPVIGWRALADDEPAPSSYIARYRMMFAP
jgi:hypothetical protein